MIKTEQTRSTKYVRVMLVSAACVDGCSQSDGPDIHPDRAVLARPHATGRRSNQERRRTGDQTAFAIYFIGHY